MITYEYFCPTNSQTVTVEHSMSESLATWSELCQRAGVPQGDTDPQAAVERLISGGLLAVTSSRTQENPLPMAGCCGNPTSCRHHH